MGTRDCTWGRRVRVYVYHIGSNEALYVSVCVSKYIDKLYATETRDGEIRVQK